MRKSLLMVAGVLLAGGIVYGAGAANYKAQYDMLTSNGAARISAAAVTNYYGSQEVLDICLSNRWDASAIAEALKGRKFSANLGGLKLPPGERNAFVRTVADGAGREAALIVLVRMAEEARDPAVADYVLGMEAGPDGGRVCKEFSLLHYCVCRSLEDGRIISGKELTLADLARFLLLGGVRRDARSLAGVKERIKKEAAPLAKRSLRGKGRSFVTKDNVNPLEAEMRPLVDALNAPKLQGLEAGLRGLGVEIADIPRDPAVWDPVAAEKDAVFNGEKPARPGADGGIILLLGPEGYNAWVKEFNEGK